jgi:hypothetical protein
MCSCKCGVEIKQLHLTDEEAIAMVKAALGNKLTSDLSEHN